MTQAFNDSWDDPRKSNITITNHPVTPRETATALAWKDGYDTARAAYDKVFAEHRAAILALRHAGIHGVIYLDDVLAILDGDRA